MSSEFMMALRGILWWRIGQVIFALALLGAIEAPHYCVGVVGPHDVHGATVQGWLEKIERNTQR